MTAKEQTQPGAAYGRNQTEGLGDLCAWKPLTRSSRRLCGLSVEGFWPQRARRGCELHSITRRKSSPREKKVAASDMGNKGVRLQQCSTGSDLS